MPPQLAHRVSATRYGLHEIVHYYGIDAVRTRIAQLHAAGWHGAANCIAAELRALEATIDG
ncbi:MULTISPECIES: hypothetical protein [unclassified Nocardia]|uniref:hypothetical protein n=1 Tax=unclassified Nocardia TaxID=2637762 RepID=UPI001CE3DBBE|nr:MULTISPECIES: hypothetical protein [unclassified Nocardia]